MCGIVFIDRLDNLPAQKIVMRRYEAQKERGQSGFGFISIDKSQKFGKWYRATNEAGIEKAIEEIADPTILFHHRQPTSTPNFIEATHPIQVNNEQLKHAYFVIHNGIISNAQSLKTEHNTLGFDYTTEIKRIFETKGERYETEMFNDSEALAIELAQVIDGQKSEIEAKGSIAFVALQLEKKSNKVLNVYYGRNYSNPLKLEKTKEFLALTSEGSGAIVEADKLFCYDLKTKETTSQTLKIGEWGTKVTTAYDYSNWERDREIDNAVGFRSTYDRNLKDEEDEFTPDLGDRLAELYEREAELKDDFEYIVSQPVAENDNNDLLETSYELADIKKQIEKIENELANEKAEGHNKTHNMKLLEALKGNENGS